MWSSDCTDVARARAVRLDFDAHRRTNLYFLGSAALAALLLCVAHDARHVFTYPGIGRAPRFGLQVVPQLALWGAYHWFTPPPLIVKDD